MPHTIDDKLLTKRLFRDIQRHNPRHFRTPHNVEEGQNAVKRLVPNFTSFESLGVSLHFIREEDYLHNISVCGVDSLIVAYKAIEHFGPAAGIKDSMFLALDPIIEQLKLRLGAKYEEELLAEQAEQDAILDSVKNAFAAASTVYYLKADVVNGDYPFLDKAGLPWLFTAENYAVEAMPKADCFKCSVASFPANALTQKLAEFINMGIKMVRLNPHTNDINVAFNCRDLVDVATPNYAAPVARSVLACLCLSEGRSSDHLINYGGEVMVNLRQAVSSTMILLPFVPKGKGTYPKDKLYYTSEAKLVAGASAASLGVLGGEKLTVADTALEEGTFDFLVTENRKYCYISAFTDVDAIYAEYGEDVNIGMFSFSDVFEFVTLDKKVKGADGVAFFCGENRLLLSAGESNLMSKVVTENPYQDYRDMQLQNSQQQIAWKEAFPSQLEEKNKGIIDKIIGLFSKKK
ncbi:MAG: hypothetical protein IJB65_07915 [Clostridia bacterium]|nr:hypothetical protein [Clostridia bacterium]